MTRGALSRLARIRRLLVRAVLLFIVLGLGAAGWGYYLVRQAPTWYQAAEAASPAMAKRAEVVEYQLAEAYHLIRDDAEPWQVELAEQDANTWLAGRMNDWMHHGDVDWPETFGVPQVHFSGESLEIALPADLTGGTQLLVARFRPRVENGELQLDPLSIGLGRLAVPVTSAAEMADVAAKLGLVSGSFDPVAALDGGAAHQLLGELIGGGAGGDLELLDGRVVELVGIAVRDGRLELTNRTTRPPP